MNRFLLTSFAIAAIICGACIYSGGTANAGPIRNFFQRIRERNGGGCAGGVGYAGRGNYGYARQSGCAAGCDCSQQGCNCGANSLGSTVCTDDACLVEAEAAFMRGGNLEKADQVAAKAFDQAATLKAQQNYEFGEPPASSKVAERTTHNLRERVARMTIAQRLAWGLLEHNEHLRKKVAAYAEARGAGKIDPNNLQQLLEVFLAFFEKLLPLILQFIN